jgi:hypothetical protein
MSTSTSKRLDFIRLFTEDRKEARVDPTAAMQELDAMSERDLCARVFDKEYKTLFPRLHTSDGFDAYFKFCDDKWPIK